MRRPWWLLIVLVGALAGAGAVGPDGDGLEKLPEANRRRVEEAADAAGRLLVIREVRDREWVERLPAKLRDEVLRLPAEKRPARVAELRQEERRQLAHMEKGTRGKGD